MTVIDKIAPYKSKQVKGNTQKWFDGEVLEKSNLRNKLFKKFKKSRLHIDKELYKKSKYYALKLIDGASILAKPISALCNCSIS